MGNLIKMGPLDPNLACLQTLVHEEFVATILRSFFPQRVNQVDNPSPTRGCVLSFPPEGLLGLGCGQASNCSRQMGLLLS